jgi:predicted DsbA family dithiol-disulfide isomerase
VLVAALIWPAVGVTQEKQPPDPATKVMEFVVRALAWYPNSIFELVSNTTFQTPSGSYRFVEVARTCASRLLTGKPTMLVDDRAGTIWLGSVGELPPFQQAGASPEAMKTFLANFLPEALNASMGLKVELEWDVGPRRPGALIPFYLLVDSGYGKYRRRAAFTADGKYLVMAAEMPLDEDPVVYRRRILAASDQVIWDVESGENAPVEIVEFSDLECPACRGKWPLIDMVLKKYQGKVRHGMASYPLTAIHPWAFRAASASWCVSLQNPRALVPFKETFYSLQREMEVSLVTPTSIDFVNGRGLDETAFRECYLRPPSIDAVHQQLSLGQGMGVNATPTYFVNGWRIQVPEGAWFPAFIETLLKGEEP